MEKSDRTSYEQLMGLLYAHGGSLELASAASLLGMRDEEVAAIIKLQGSQLTHEGLVILLHDQILQLATAPELSPKVREMFNLESAKELTPAAKETLAIVVYHQPVDRATVESIRGIDCRRTLQSLAQKGLIEQSTSVPQGGDPRAYYYQVSLKFLEYFGLSHVDDLKSKITPQQSPT